MIQYFSAAGFGGVFFFGGDFVIFVLEVELGVESFDFGADFVDGLAVELDHEDELGMPLRSMKPSGMRPMRSWMNLTGPSILRK
jgi:hypothetical protein